MKDTKYQDMATTIAAALNADAVIIGVVGGERGDGTSVVAKDAESLKRMEKMFADMMKQPPGNPMHNGHH